MTNQYLHHLRVKLQADKYLLEENLVRLLQGSSIPDHVNTHDDVYKLIAGIDELKGQIETIDEVAHRKGL